MKAGMLNRNARAGFTLIELILVVFLVGIISVSLATIFSSSIDLGRETSGRNDTLEEARNAMNRIVKELGNSTKVYYLGPDSLHFDTSYNLGSTVVTQHISYEPMNDGLYLSKDWGSTWLPFIENVQSFSVRGMTLWSTLDDEWSILSPELGNGGSISGSSDFRSMKHETGYYGGSDWPASTANFPMPNLLHDDQGTVEFWFCPDYSIDHSGSYDKCLISTQGGFGKSLELFFDPDTDQLVYQIEAGVVREIRWTPDWEVGSLLHVAVTWSSSGEDIGGGRTMALFIDGEEKSDLGTQTSGWTASGTFGSNLVLGDASGQYPSRASFDNLKVYDYCKSNFDDRNTLDISGIVKIELIVGEDAERITLRTAANIK